MAANIENLNKKQETETESDSGNSEQETAEQSTENKPFNVTELLTRITNQMNEYNKNGKAEQIEALKWVIEQVQEILK